MLVLIGVGMGADGMPPTPDQSKRATAAAMANLAS